MTYEQALRFAAQNAGNRENTCNSINGKIAVVTGGAQGFGAGIARVLLSRGATVLVADLPEQESKARNGLQGFSQKQADFFPCDVSDESRVREMTAFCVERFGGIDLLVSNAGIARAGGLNSITTEEFNRILQVNLTGYYYCVKYAAPVMKAQNRVATQNWCDIVQINSKSGLAGSKRNFAYAASKFGAVGLTQSFALELAEYRIKVNAVCPGNYYEGPHWAEPQTGLLTQFLQEGKVPFAESAEDVKQYYLKKQVLQHRGCTPEDVARAVLYCVEQPFETGQAIPVAAGQIMLH